MTASQSSFSRQISSWKINNLDLIQANNLGKQKCQLAGCGTKRLLYEKGFAKATLRKDVHLQESCVHSYTRIYFKNLILQLR